MLHLWKTTTFFVKTQDWSRPQIMYVNGTLAKAGPSASRILLFVLVDKI